MGETLPFKEATLTFKEAALTSKGVVAQARRSPRYNAHHSPSNPTDLPQHEGGSWDGGEDESEREGQREEEEGVVELTMRRREWRREEEGEKERARALAKCVAQVYCMLLRAGQQQSGTDVAYRGTRR